MDSSTSDAAFTPPRDQQSVDCQPDLGEWWDDLLYKRGLGPRWSGSGKIESRCPSHDDRQPSMSSKILDDRVLVYCHAGCSVEDICTALGVKQSELFARNGRQSTGEQAEIKRRPDDTPDPLPSDADLKRAQDRLHGSDIEKRLQSGRGWNLFTIISYELGLSQDGRIVIPIRDEGGELVTVERYAAFGESDTKTLALKGRPRPLLLPPDGLHAEIFITEGRSDAIAAASHGLHAVGAPSASIWKEDQYPGQFKAAGVQTAYVIGDSDIAGRKFAPRVAGSLTGKGIKALTIDLDPSRDDGFDLTDYLKSARERGDTDVSKALKSLAKPYVREQAPAQNKMSFKAVAPSLDRVKPIRWAWRDWLVMGMLNLLVGDESAGKGTLIAHLIAQLSRGKLDGDLYGEPAMVLIIGDEDDFDRIWTPRLLVAGADFNLIRRIQGNHGATMSFPSGIDHLRQMVVETKARGVFFDQLLDNLDANLDDWRTKQVREAILPLHSLARELQFVAIGALHTNKARGGSFRQSVSGSHAFNSVSRSSLLVALHPDGPEERRVVARGKGNYARRPISQEFVIEGRSPRIGDQVIQTSVAVRFEDSPLTADDLLATRKAEPTSKAARAREYMKRVLADGEPHDAAPIIEYLEKELGMGERQIRQAREDVDAISERRPEFQGGATYRLPRRHELFSRNGRNGRNAEIPIPANPAIPANPLVPNGEGRNGPVPTISGSAA